MRALLLLLVLVPPLAALPYPAYAQPDTVRVPVQLSIASLQLPDRQDPAWEQRNEEIAQLLGTLRPDVVAVQQVLQENGRNPACWLARRLRYSCDFVTVDPPSQGQRHGNAMLSRLPVSEDGVTLLHPPGRYSAAGMMRVEVDGQPVNIYVARLRPGDGAASSRQHQTSDLMAWISATSEGLPSVIVGDFAAGSSELVRSTPGFQPVRRNPNARTERSGTPAEAAGGHGLDVLFQVKHFSGLRQQWLDLPAQGGMQALRLGVLAVLRLQVPDAVETVEPPMRPAG